MEMVLQQSAAGMIHGVAACRPRPAATAPMMMAKQEERDADEDQRRESEEEEEQQQRQRMTQAGAEGELRRGPWTVDEDLTLINYISDHGEGRWNALARAAGLKRTGKSCRLRWLNYLRPDVKRGDFTADEQLLILDLHSRWGNRWSKIAAQLPGRTDNEIKNYWRTRVQKHAKQLNCDVNSSRFKDAMRFLWMPRLAERAAATAAAGQPSPSLTPCTGATAVSSSALMMLDTTSNGSSSSGSSCSPSSAVTTAACSSSCSSLTSDDGARHAAAAAEPVLTVTNDDYWGAATTTTTTQQQNEHYDFWSTASALQHLCTAGGGGGDNHHQLFQQVVATDHDLTGWVQGFSDVILSGSGSSSDDDVWSLDDIWRMQ